MPKRFIGPAKHKADRNGNTPSSPLGGNILYFFTEYSRHHILPNLHKRLRKK